MTTPPLPPPGQGTPRYGQPGPPHPPGPPPWQGPGPYAQQPQLQPYAAPPAPYGQFPPHGPYGPPPMGPPPRRGGAGKVIGIVVAVLAGAYILFRGIAEVVTGGAPSEPASYTLTLPATLENGGLTLSEDMSDTFRRTVPHRALKPVAGRYDARSGDEQLVFAGYTGPVQRHEGAGDRMLDGMEQNGGTELAVPRREITPAGTDEPLTCEVLIKKEDGEEFTVPVCVWSDPGTVGAVMDNSPETFATAPDAIDLDAFAERVSGIRDEVRVPAG